MPGFRRSTYGPYPGYDVGDLARKRYVDQLKRRAGLWPGDVALDVECGYGIVAVQLARGFTKARVVATDRDPDMLARTRENARIEGALDRLALVRADPAFLPFREETFAVTTWALALRDVEEPERVLEEVHRATAFAGKLFVVEVDFTKSRARPPATAASVLDDAFFQAAREAGWGKFATQRVDLLRDGSQLLLVTAKRFDVDDAEDVEDAEAEAFEEGDEGEAEEDEDDEDEDEDEEWVEEDDEEDDEDED